jgi:hypothetical protein
MEIARDHPGSDVAERCWALVERTTAGENIRRINAELEQRRAWDWQQRHLSTPDYQYALHRRPWEHLLRNLSLYGTARLSGGG